MSAQVAILIEAEVTSLVGVTTTLRFSDRAVRPMSPADADRPNVAWDDRLIEAPTMRRALFTDFSTLTPDVGTGVALLANGELGLAAHEGSTWGAISVLRWSEGTPFASAKLIFKGVCAGQASYRYPAGRPARVQLGFHDYRLELEKNIQQATFAGTNDDEDIFYEGTADGLKGKVKPLAYGDLTTAHLAAPMVNPGVLAHQLHDGEILGPVTVFDRGYDAGVDNDGDFSGSAFDDHDPAAAHYATDLDRGLVKINADPAGTLSFGCKGDAAGGYVETTGPIVARLLAKAGVPAPRIDAGIAALDDDAPIGVYAAEAISARELVAWTARSALAAVAPDRFGVWKAWPIAPPSATPDITLADDQVVSISADDSAPLPVGLVRVGYGRIWTTFTGEQLAADLRGTDAEPRLKEEYRWAEQADAVVQARLPESWRTLEITTALRNEADALALAAKIMALFGLRPDGKPRRQWSVIVEATDQALGVDLGRTVRLIKPDKAIDDRFLLLAVEPLRPKRNFAIWTVWG